MKTKWVVRKYMSWYVIKNGDNFLLATNGTKQLFLSRKSAETVLAQLK